MAEVLQGLERADRRPGEPKIDAPRRVYWYGSIRRRPAGVDARPSRAIGQECAAPRLTLRADLVSSGVIRCRVLGDGYGRNSTFRQP